MQSAPETLILGMGAGPLVFERSRSHTPRYWVLLALARSSGMPMQVVKPSVPLAAVLHGMAFTVFVEIPSSPTLSKPVVVPGNHGVPSEGATPVIGGGAVTVGGGPPIDPGACCANADNDERARAAATEDVVLPKRIETSFELQQQLHKTPNLEIPQARCPSPGPGRRILARKRP